MSLHLCLIGPWEYCNSFLSGLPPSHLHLLRSILHIAARICLSRSPPDHQIPIENRVCRLCSPGVYSLINDPPSFLTGFSFCLQAKSPQPLLQGSKPGGCPQVFGGRSVAEETSVMLPCHLRPGPSAHSPPCSYTCLHFFLIPGNSLLRLPSWGWPESDHPRSGPYRTFFLSSPMSWRIRTQSRAHFGYCLPTQPSRSFCPFLHCLLLGHFLLYLRAASGMRLPCLLTLNMAARPSRPSSNATSSGSFP